MTLSFSTVRSAGRRTPSVGPFPSLLTILAVWKERRELTQMTPARLRDIGISPQDAATEAARPIWDMPPRACR